MKTKTKSKKKPVLPKATKKNFSKKFAGTRYLWCVSPIDYLDALRINITKIDEKLLRSFKLEYKGEYHICESKEDFERKRLEVLMSEFPIEDLEVRYLIYTEEGEIFIDHESADNCITFESLEALSKRIGEIDSKDLTQKINTLKNEINRLERLKSSCKTT